MVYVHHSYKEVILERFASHIPAATDGAYAAVRGVSDNGAGLNRDATRLTVAGDSAGVHLAVAAASDARDGDGPRFAAQIQSAGGEALPITAGVTDAADFIFNGIAERRFRVTRHPEMIAETARSRAIALADPVEPKLTDIMRAIVAG